MQNKNGYEIILETVLFATVSRKRRDHCSSHPGAVYARAGGRGGGQWTLRYPPRRLPPQPDASLLRLRAENVMEV
jgi:hypothetical protein